MREKTRDSIRIILEAGKSMEDSYQKQKATVREFFVFSDDFADAARMVSQPVADISGERYLELLGRLLATTDEMTLKYERMGHVIREMIDLIKKESEEDEAARFSRPASN